MVGNCEKMLLIPSSTTNKEKEQIDEKTLVMASNGGNHMENPTQEQQQQPVLKCPRCDSSNTKFCYYNNYSLSQPRHFCKACKRYWTRGGTLRNVPVGGGCRKNKRIKKPSASSSSTTASVSLPNITTTTNPSHNTHYINQTNPLLSGLGFSSSGNNHNIPFARLFSCRDEGQVFSGLGFSSSGGVMENYGHGYNSIKQIQDVMSCNNTTASTTTSLLSSYPMFGSLHTNNFHSLGPNNDYGEELHMSGNNNGIMLKLEDKMEVGSHDHQIDQTISSDPSLSWNGAWLDPSNLGSSVPSLI